MSDRPSVSASVDARLEAALSAAVDSFATLAPPRLVAAARDALFPGGQRLRPRLVVAVAASVRPAALAEEALFRAAAAVECVHAASLVHDDLPCFDDADLRRGRPTLHRAYDEATALLVGDGLLTLAFEELAAVGDVRLLRVLLRATGLHGGLVAGQGWELEPAAAASPDESAIRRYHAGKTSALFAAAAELGARIAGEPDATAAVYASLGHRIGSLYQLADDLVDVVGAAASGKSGGRDEALARPSYVRLLGVDGARARFEEEYEALLDACPTETLRGFLAQALTPVRRLVLPEPVRYPAAAGFSGARRVATASGALARGR